MKVCKHAKDQRGHCWVVGCDNNRLNHWPYKTGAKRPVGLHKVHKGEPCKHEHTRPASKDDQRPYCVSCLTIVGD